MKPRLEIERSIITKFRAALWSKFTKAIDRYGLIEAGDRICACVSGGKDSILLCKLLQELRNHSKIEFDVKFLLLDPGYAPDVMAEIAETLDGIGIRAETRKARIFEHASSAKGKTACYLCAKMRRGALYSNAEKMGCDKIALGHHRDDAIETVLLNLLNAGSIGGMMPKLNSAHYPGMRLIRPMYLIREEDIEAWAEFAELRAPVHVCRFTAKGLDDSLISQRAKTKALIQTLNEYNANSEKNILAALGNVRIEKILGCECKGRKYDFGALFDAFDSNADFRFDGASRPGGEDA